MFNAGQYWERVPRRELIPYVIRIRHPSPPLAGEPVCTHSQIVSYRNAADQEVARVHQYLRRDGTIGLSGLPDPKWLLVDGILYMVASEASL